MPLRAFHIAFIVVSIALSVVGAACGVRVFLTVGSTSALVVGLGGALAGTAVVVYGKRFFRKLQELA
jgi:hypothetical protein